MKAFALLFGILAFMLNITLSSMVTIKKCRKLLATSSQVVLLNSNTKDQTTKTDHPTEKTCSASTPVVTIVQSKEPLAINILTQKFIMVENHQYIQQYIEPPFAPPRQEKKFSGNLF
jgi:hypothetical protein